MFVSGGRGGSWWILVFVCFARFFGFVLFFINRKYVHYRNNLNEVAKQLGAHAQSHVQMHGNGTSLTQKEQVPIYTTWSSSPTELLLLASAPGPDLAPYAPSFTNRSSFAERLHGAAGTLPERRSPGRARCLFPCRESSCTSECPS